MCEFCKKVAGSSYGSKISQYMLEDIERMIKTENNPMFSQRDFPFIEPLVYLEPRVAMPKPTRYYQPMSVDGKMLRLDWSSGSMRALGFGNGKIVLLTKSVIKRAGEPERLNYYFLAELDKSELNVKERGNELTVSFRGNVHGINIKNRGMEQHAVEFTFIHQNNERAFVPKERAAASAIYGKSTRAGGQEIASRFENYAVTVMHFAPHPLLLYSYKELGFASPLELQRGMYGVLREHLL